MDHYSIKIYRLQRLLTYSVNVERAGVDPAPVYSDRLHPEPHRLCV
jgi:hypothetical protein